MIEHLGRGSDAIHGTTHEGRELMRSNSDRDRHMTNHHRASTLSHRKSYRDPHDYHNNSNGQKGIQKPCFKIDFHAIDDAFCLKFCRC